MFIHSNIRTHTPSHAQFATSPRPSAVVDLPASPLASPLLLPLPHIAAVHLLASVDTSRMLMRAAVLYTGNRNYCTMHLFDDSNHDDKAQEVSVAAVAKLRGPED